MAEAPERPKRNLYATRLQALVIRLVFKPGFRADFIDSKNKGSEAMVEFLKGRGIQGLDRQEIDALLSLSDSEIGEIGSSDQARTAVLEKLGIRDISASIIIDIW
ncbi:MAG: hypothetical protein ACFFER_08595 [Candidatus Thorarchaeota archaeon]